MPHPRICLILLFTFFVFFNQPAHAISFSAGDLTGNWYGHQIVTGDAPSDEPRWGYGTVVVNNQGQYTSTWTGVNQANEVTQGTITINSLGSITINNQPLSHGKMSEDKELIVFIDGTPANDGHGLGVLVKRKPGQTFTPANLAGTWYGHHIVSGDAPADDPRWGYGTAVINSQGGYTATWTSPGNTNEVTQGSIQLNASGYITLNGQPLTHGVINDARDLIVFIDGTSQSQGNALTVMMKRAPIANFSVSDLGGLWCGYHVVSGDDPPDDPRWGYGKISINSQGDYTATWNSPTQFDEVSQGTVRITASGVIRINNEPLTHGAMNDDKSMFVFIDGSGPSSGNALNVVLRCSEIALQGMQQMLLLSN